MRTSMVRAAIAALLGSLATAAFAGGPTHTYDHTNRIPYAWVMSSWPNGQVPIYTDLGTLGILTNERADTIEVNGAVQWSGVPTSSFRAAVVGDFSALGLGDITLATITSIVGTSNGGGIDVVYDADGSIMTNYFGVDPTGVLGITAVELVDATGPEIVEAWTVLSGPGVNASDPNGVGFAGVAVHEMGHALNLAHTDSNGSTQASTRNDAPQPTGCGAPWTGKPDATQIETMYPFLTPTPTGSGAYAASVDRLDDRAALSNLYAGPGWPGNRGTIRGQILDSTGTSQLGSVNVIARNAADPFNDFTSYISGQISKQQAGPDGSFELNGLTPGASYVIYVNGLLSGSYSVPRILTLPGPEEYYNGAMEGGNGETDNRCSWTTVRATPGSPVTANILFNKISGAPEFIPQPVPGYPDDITPDGSIVVIALGTPGPVARWDVNAGTVENLGGTDTGMAAISDDGSKIAADVLDPSDNTVKYGIYQNGAWTILPPIPDAIPCTQSGSTTYGSVYDISGDGSTVVGLAYQYGCNQAGIRGFKWTAAGGTVALPKVDSFSRAGRANTVNYDGSVIAGWDDNASGFRRGEYWVNGTPHLILYGGQPTGEALDVTGDGHYVVGLSSQPYTAGNAWRFSQSGGVELLGKLPGGSSSGAAAISADGKVVGGWTDFSSGRAPTIWTSALHWTNFEQFMNVQGSFAQDVFIMTPTAMSADGRTIVGWANSVFGAVGWMLKTPTSVVCHATPGNPTDLHTIVVPFPDGLNDALNSGDTLGVCSCNAAAPTGIPTMLADKPSGTGALLSWGAVAGASGYDLVRGSLASLRSSGGNFATSTTDCLENDYSGVTRDDEDTPSAGDGFWYLVRGVSCGGAASYDSGAPSQIGLRDAEIQASPTACP